MILACFQMSAPIFFCRGRSLLQDPEPSYRFYDCLFHNPGATSFGPAEKAAGSTELLCPSDRRQSQGGRRIHGRAGRQWGSFSNRNQTWSP